MDQYIGKFLDDRYEILDVLGTGGMAVVYKAKCHRLNRMVAIKILKEDLAEDEEIRNRFHDESQAVAQLNNPNIVNVFDVNQSDGVEYIVMELIEGITLKQYMRKRGTSLNWREALHFTVQILQALRHAHSRGIIHRDIKPQNIMVLRDGSVKVADFGIARINGSQRTMTQEALGSVHYISPEQARGSVIDARSDLYSAGVVLYEMLTGTLPYTGDSPVAVALQHVNSVPKPPRAVNPDIPLGMEQITKRAMAPNRDLRYDDADAMLADLDAFRKNPAIDFGYSDPWVLDGRIEEDEPTMIRKAVVLPPKDPEPEAELIPEEEPEFPEEEPLPVEEYPLEEFPSEEYPPEEFPPEEEQPEFYEEDRLPEEYDSEEVGGGRSAATAGALVAIVNMVALIGILVWRLFAIGFFGGGMTYVVPDLTGKTYAEAVADIAKDDDLKGHFTVRVSEEKAYDGAYEPGEIIKQEPKQGSKTRNEETDITVTLCAEEESQAEVKYMPSIVGEDYQTWNETLTTDYGVVVNYRNEYNDEYDKNLIIATDPKAGVELKEGQTVKLYVSKGPKVKTATMVTLVGMTESQARRALGDLQLKVGRVDKVDSDEKKGRVVFQSVKEGSEVEVGTQVNIQISKGPQEQEDNEYDGGTPEDQYPGTDETGTEDEEDQTIHQIKVTMPEERDSDSSLVIKVNDEIISSNAVSADESVKIVAYTGAIDKIEVTVDGMAYDNYTVS